MFNAAELSDIRIALQDRIAVIADAEYRYRERNKGQRDDVAVIEMDRLRMIVRKVDSLS